MLNTSQNIFFMSTFLHIYCTFLVYIRNIFYTCLTFFNYMINFFLNIYIFMPISSSRPTVGRQDAISPRWADRGQSASCRPTGIQSARCGPTRPSQPAAGRRCIIFEKKLPSVIFLKINKKMYYLKKISKKQRHPAIYLGWNQRFPAKRK